MGWWVGGGGLEGEDEERPSGSVMHSTLTCGDKSNVKLTGVDGEGKS